MPIYGYTCRACGHHFDRYIKTHKQASCKRAYPNKRVAPCPECSDVGERNLKDINLSKLIGGFGAVVNLIGKPTPDPMYDGKLAVSAGRNYGVVIDSGKDNEENADVPEYIINKEIECDCEFCNPSVKEQSNGEKAQLKIDIMLADMIDKGGGALSGVHVDSPARAKGALEQKNFQRWLDDQGSSGNEELF